MKPPARQAPSEVQAYVRRLVALIFVGIVLMTSAAVWAWNTYGGRLETAPPLPEGTPPMHVPTP